MKLKYKFRDSKGVLHQAGDEVLNLSDKDVEALKANGHTEDGKENSSTVGNENENVTPLKAKEVIEKIQSATTAEEVDAIVGNDERATVLKAAEARKAEL